MKRGFLLAPGFVMLLASQAAAEACNADALGTSRTIFLDTSKGLEVGQRFGHSLPLADKEVVLTFDDGPIPQASEKVRQALKNECVKATFFIVGRNALNFPSTVRALAADGHSIGTHTWSHDMRLPEQPLSTGMSQINRGIAAVSVALKSSPEEQQESAPFFRFPGLNSDHRFRDILRDRGIGVFDIDIEGGDWIVGRTPAQVLHRLKTQLQEKRRGIILLHDIQPRTAAMLPEFLKHLKKEGFKVVHIEAAPKPDAAIAALQQDAAEKPFQTAAATTALDADDMVPAGPGQRRNVAKPDSPHKEPQRMAALAPAPQAEPKAKIEPPRKPRVERASKPEPPRRQLSPAPIRYAQLREFSPPAQMAAPQPRKRQKYLLNELFRVYTN